MRPHSLLVIFALATACALVACAPPERAAFVAPARLEVVNPSPEIAEVFLRGDLLGRVSPGERRVFDGVRPVSAPVSLSRPGVTAAPIAVDFRPGETRELAVPLAEGESPLPTPVGLGALRITNHLPFDVEVRQGDRALAVVFSGSELTVRDLPAGDATFVARGYVDARAWVIDRTIPVGGVAEWLVDSPRSALLIENNGFEAIVVHLDKDSAMPPAPLLVPPGETLRIDGLLVGRHTIDAISKESLIREQSAVQLDEGTALTWTFAAPNGALEVVNGSGEPVEVLLDAESLGTLPKGEVRRFEKLRPGERVLTGTGMQSGMRYELPIVLEPAQTFYWRISDRHGTVAISNRSTESMEVSLGGSPAFLVRPGQTRFVANVDSGPIEARAYGVKSRHRQRAELVVQASATVWWEVASKVAAVVLTSTRPDGVEIWIDGRTVAQLPAGGVLHLDGVLPGERRIEARAADPQWSAEYRVVVPDGGEVAQTVHRPGVAVTLVNATGEDLALGPVLGGADPELAVGASTVRTIPPGAWAVAMRGERTGLTYGQRLEAKDGDAILWEVQPRLGAVHVFNRRPEAVVISVDGQSRGTVGAGETALLGEIPMGKRDMTAVGVATEHQLEVVLPVSDERPTPWEVGIEMAGIHLANRTEEAVEVKIDGRPYGRVEANGALGVGGITPGGHRVTAAAARTGRRYEMDLAFLEGRTHRWQIEEESGRLMVANQRGEAISLALSGQPMAELAPRSTWEATTPEGSRVLTATSLESRGAARQTLTVRPQQTFEWRVPETTASIRVSNGTPHTLLIKANGRQVGRVYAGETTVLGGVPSGGVRLSAIAEDKTGPLEEWVLRGEVQGGTEVAWGIRPLQAAVNPVEVSPSSIAPSTSPAPGGAPER